jgi:hypothetical protein
MANYPFSTKVQPVGSRKHDNEPVNVSNLKPYRTKAQKAEAKATATRRGDGAWRTDAVYSIRPDHMRSA